MHIAFLTLFLGLTSGVQPFELSVSGPVASIEILVDGAVAQRLSGPPWKGEIDFGPDLAPHELAARALDASGKEVARTRQGINLPRPPAEVEIALESPHTVRLSWERLTHEPPVQTTLVLDGREIRLDGDRRASLPAYDPGSTHVLTAELRFPSNVVARKDLIFGGEGGETHTELTAVPVEIRHGRLPAVRDLQGWFLKDDGAPLRVAAVEEGPGELYLVRVPGPDAVRSQIGPIFGNHLPLLDKGDQIRIVSPWSKAYQGEGTRSDLFDLSPHFAGLKGLGPHLVAGFFQPDASVRLRFGDAAAVAGLHAMAGGRRRIVVLVLDSRSPDNSLYDPVTVRRYLSSIRVPLSVWTIDRDTSGLKDWGEIENASTSELMSRAFRKSTLALERQRIVWLEGRHLPQSIRLSPQAKGIALAGAVDGLPPAPPRQEVPALDLVTALPYLVAGDQPLQGKLTVRGEPLRVAAVERGPGEILAIRVPALEETRTLLAPRLEKPEPEGILRSLLSLDKEHSMRLVSPRPQVDPAPAAWLGLFNLLPALPRRDQALLFDLTNWDFTEEDPLREVRVADAVAVAGLQAAAAGRRRAVLLIPGGSFEDRSRLEPAAVRTYLASLGVPLYVWPLKDPFPAWEATQQDLEVDLEQQRILWVEGRHLAREVRLAPEITNLELLAR